MHQELVMLLLFFYLWYTFKAYTHSLRSYFCIFVIGNQ